MKRELKALTNSKQVTTQVVATLEHDRCINTVYCLISLVLVGVTTHLGVCQKGVWLCLVIACCGNMYISGCCRKFKKGEQNK